MMSMTSEMPTSTETQVDPPRDIATEGLGPIALADAVRQIRDAGLTIIENALPLDLVEELHQAYDELLASRPEGHVQNTSGEHHVQMQLQIRPPFSDPGVITHPAVRQVLTELLGPGFVATYYNSNTALPGSTPQPVHRDAKIPLFGNESSVPTPPLSIVLNIPLIDFTVENGSTEVWPTTHLIMDQPDEATTLDHRVAPMASVRLNAKAGSIVLRDSRAWHRGMPNRSGHQRTMLAVVYSRGFLSGVHPNMHVSQEVFDSWPEETQRVFGRVPHDG